MKPDLTPDEALVDGSRFYRLLRGGLARVRLVGLELHGYSRGAVASMTFPVSSINEIRVRRWWVWSLLTIRLADGRKIRVGGCDRGQAMRFSQAVHSSAARYAEGWGVELRRLAARLESLLTGDRYLRHSVCSEVPHRVNTVAGAGGRLVCDNLEPEAKTALEKLSGWGHPDSVEKTRAVTNRQFLSEAVPKVKAASRRVLSFPLTDEQAEAVATDEDSTLVLAGAGTGKTAVIVGKVDYLVRSLRKMTLS